VYNEFVEYQLEYETQLREAYMQLEPPRPGHPLYEAAVAYYEDLQNDRASFLDSLTRAHPGSYASRMINAFRSPIIPGSLPHEQRIRKLQAAFFLEAGIDDPSLLYAPVYTYRIMEYLSLYRDDSLDPEAQEQAFLEAVDQIMVHVSSDAELRNFATTFLLEGFEYLGMEAVQVHLFDHYIDEFCEADIAQLVAERMEGYKNMATGMQVPELAGRDEEGATHRLSGLDNEYVLVVFWSSTCGHCRNMMPELARWYQEDRTLDLEVLALSIDTSYSLYLDYLEELNAPWIEIYDPLGWNGKAAGDYHIYATPSMFLVDQKRRILSRPVNMRQFYRAIRKVEEL
jgi:thiol-disulfide isomerase/thioredoxin